MFLNIEDIDKMNESTEHSTNIQNQHKIINYTLPEFKCNISNQSLCEFNSSLDTAEYKTHKVKN